MMRPMIADSKMRLNQKFFIRAAPVTTLLRKRRTHEPAQRARPQ